MATLAAEMNDLPVAVAVALGGASGALLRYGLMLGLGGLSGRVFYLVTLFINVSGSFVLGVLYGLGQRRGLPAWMTGLLGVGVLGAYTTFSTFAVEIVRLLQADRPLEAVLYVLLSVSLAVAAALICVRMMLQ
jgi:CrcB protein